MPKSRLFRFRDRASYKPSEVLGLFIISLFLGMLFFGMCMAVDHLLQALFGWGRSDPPVARRWR